MADTSLKTDVPPDCDDISPGVSITSNPVADQPASTTPTATTPTARDLSYTMKEDIAVEPPMLYLKEQSGVVQKSDEPEETLEALQARNNENRAALIALLVASVLILMALSLW